jgi:hypothetical protein
MGASVSTNVNQMVTEVVSKTMVNNAASCSATQEQLQVRARVLYL